MRAKGLFSLRKILFVLQKDLSTRNHFRCERFFDPPKLSQVPPNFKDAVNYFLLGEKIYCSLTDTLQLASHFVIERSFSKLSNDSPQFQMSTEKDFREVTTSYQDSTGRRWRRRLLAPVEFKSPSVKAESFPTKPEVIVH